MHLESLRIVQSRFTNFTRSSLVIFYRQDELCRRHAAYGLHLQLPLDDPEVSQAPGRCLSRSDILDHFRLVKSAFEHLI